MGNEKMERARGIANLIQELLRGIQNYTFGVSLTLEAAKTCSSNPGVGGIFFLTLAPFLLHLFSFKSLSLSP